MSHSTVHQILTRDFQQISAFREQMPTTDSTCEAQTMDMQTSFIIRQWDNNNNGTVHHHMAMLTSHYLEVEQGLGGSHAATNPGHRGPALPPLLPANRMFGNMFITWQWITCKWSWKSLWTGRACPECRVASAESPWEGCREIDNQAANRNIVWWWHVTITDLVNVLHAGPDPEL